MQPRESLLLGASTSEPLLNYSGRFAAITQTGGKLHTIPYYWNTQTLSYEVASTGGSGVGQEVKVTNFPAIQPISAASLPLPTGASTAARQDITNANLASLTMYAGIARTAFGWLRSSSPVTLFDQAGFRYGKEPLIWEDVLTGTGATTHNATAGVITLSTGGTASGAKVVRQSRQYMRYQPGKGGLVMQSFCLGVGDANVRRRAGYFDADGGFYLQCVNGALSLVLRTKTSGAVVEQVVPKASWNGAAITLDTTKTLLMAWSFEWLGVGMIKVAIADPTTGELSIVHTFQNVNQTVDVPYMQTASLPLRYEIENTGTAGGTRTLTQICAAVISEGGFEDGRGLAFAASRGTTTVGVTTRRPVLSLQPQLTFGGVRNSILYDFLHMEVCAQTNDCFWELVYNGTLTGASFAAVDSTNSSMNVDISATAISGGVVLESGYALTGSGSTRGLQENSMLARVPMGLDLAGAVADKITLVCTAMSGTSNIGAAIHFRETR